MFAFLKFCFKSSLLSWSPGNHASTSQDFLKFSLQVLKWLGGKQELLKEAYLQVHKQSIIKMQLNLYNCMKQITCIRGCPLCYLPLILPIYNSVSLFGDHFNL